MENSTFRTKKSELKGERLFFLDGIRGVAAISVMLFHFTQHNHLSILVLAPLAVDIFFCLSGYVIASSYLERIKNGQNFFIFISKRLIRLYPTYILSLLFGVVTIYLNETYKGWGFTHTELIKAFLCNILYIPYENSNTILIGNAQNPLFGVIFPFNPPAWSLFYEILVNILFFYTVRKGYTTSNLSKKTFTTIMIVFILSLVLNGHALGLGWGSGIKQFIYGILRVTSGFFVGYMVYTSPKPRSYYLSYTALVTLFIVFSIPISRINYAILIIVTPLIVYLGSSTLTSHFGERVCRWLGDISYPIYCLHFPCLFLFNDFIQLDHIHYNFYVFLTCGSVVLLSHAVFYYIDEPVRMYLNSLLNNARRRPSVNTQTSDA